MGFLLQGSPCHRCTLALDFGLDVFAESIGRIAH